MRATQLKAHELTIQGATLPIPTLKRHLTRKTIRKIVLKLGIATKTHLDF